MSTKGKLLDADSPCCTNNTHRRSSKQRLVDKSRLLSWALSLPPRLKSQVIASGVARRRGLFASPLDGMSKSCTIKKLFEDKGFGFVTPDDGGSDVFVHYRENPCLQRCRRGDAVTFDTKWDVRKNKYYGTRLTIKDDGGESTYRCPLPTSARKATTRGSAAKSKFQQVPVRGHPLEYAM